MVVHARGETPRVRLFGPPEVFLGDRPVPLSAKAVGLIAYLALQSRPAPRDVVTELLWPDSGLESGRKNLRNTLWSIRKAIGEEAVVGDDERVELGPSVWLDLRVFEAEVEQNPRAAIELYRGAFLDGLGFIDAAEFEIWIDRQRRRLSEQHVRALSRTADQLRARESWRDLIRVADSAIAHDNVHEPMYRALMEGYARLGERGEALRRYDDLRESLDRELGVAPLAETRALREAIAVGKIRPAAARPDGPGRLGRAPGVAPPFVGRVGERAALDGALREASRGSARVALLTGELGIGKSRLWQEWSRTLPSGATVLEARCLDATQSLPFAPLVELLSNAALCQRIAAPEAPIDPVWLAEVARLAPHLASARPDLPTAATLPALEERGRVFEGLVQVLLALGGSPLVLFVDDAHWGDRTTLEWLRYLVHRLRDARLLLVVAYRPDEAPSTLAQLVANWGREGAAQRISLARLSSDEEDALGAAVAGDSGRVERARRQASGNPYFLLELLRSASEDVPTVLSALIQARIDRLSDSAKQVVRGAAVLEPVLDVETLRATTGREEVELLDAIDELRTTGIIAERSDQLEFAHPLISTVVRDGLSGPRRTYLFRRAAEALEQSHADQVGGVAGRLVALYREAGDRSRAAHSADRAAERSLAMAAVDEAVDFYRQALALEATPTRRAALARLLVRLGDFNEARTAFEQALSEFEAAGDVAGAARASAGVAESYVIVGRRDEVGHWARRTLALVDRDPDPATQVLAHLLMGLTALGAGGFGTGALPHLESAARIATEFNLPDLAGRATFGLGNYHAERGDLDLARRLFQRAVEHARAAGDRHQEVLAYNNAAYHAMLAGDLDDAGQLIDRALALVERYAFRLPLAYVFNTRGEIALATGRLDEAFDWLSRALKEAEDTRNVEQRASSGANLALVERARGNLDAAVLQLESAKATLEGVAVLHLRIKIELWLSETYQLRGEMAAADTALRRAETLLVDGDRRLLQDWATRQRRSLVAPLDQPSASLGRNGASSSNV